MHCSYRSYPSRMKTCLFIMSFPVIIKITRSWVISFICNNWYHKMSNKQYEILSNVDSEGKCFLWILSILLPPKHFKWILPIFLGKSKSVSLSYSYIKISIGISKVKIPKNRLESVLVRMNRCLKNFPIKGCFPCQTPRKKLYCQKKRFFDL